MIHLKIIVMLIDGKVFIWFVLKSLNIIRIEDL